MSRPSSPDLWRKVLVPTDFSDCSLPALRAAGAMGQRSGLEVVLLHVTEPAYQGLRVQTGDLHERMRHEAEHGLKKLAAEHFPNAENIRVLVKDGRPAEVICQTAADEKVDAVLIPTHGHSGLKHALLGSVAEKVARQAPCSVLVVRE
ncbi:universal stress protein [Prosthecobacter sp.]|jgi:nucleotide-binding universal stress UspA family protein|uniref:universal stress protein n=1 Tax=Prosthecobacter sp. TaxID=1965333 RepID=UPI003783499E